MRTLSGFLSLLLLTAGCAEERRRPPPLEPIVIEGWAQPVGTTSDGTGYPKRIRRNADGGEMELIPAGTFRMGRVPGDTTVTREGENDAPQHSVTLSTAYYLDVTEVANAQFEMFVAATGYKTSAEREGKAWVMRGDEEGAMIVEASWRSPLPGEAPPSDWSRHPAVLVSWDDAMAFCHWVGATLPTEAQFERALRGGTEGAKYPWGNSLPPPKDAGNFWGEEFRRAYPKTKSPGIVGFDDGIAITASVASFPANAFGIQDLSGNVSEWCFDYYDWGYNGDSPMVDPSGPTLGSDRVVRGGCWLSAAVGLRASDRDSGNQDGRSDYFGFRCARSISHPPQNGRKMTFIGLSPDNWIAIAGLAGAAFAFFLGLRQYRRAQLWKRAEWIAQEMQTLFDRPEVHAALLMIDWDSRSVVLREGTEPVFINDEEVCAALRPHGPDCTYPRAQPAIRDAFDAFFDGLERFASYLEVRLIDVADLRPYLEYWAGRVHGENMDAGIGRTHAIQKYLLFYHYERVVNLFQDLHCRSTGTPVCEFAGKASA